MIIFLLIENKMYLNGFFYIYYLVYMKIFMFLIFLESIIINILINVYLWFGIILISYLLEYDSEILYERGFILKNVCLMGVLL